MIKLFLFSSFLICSFLVQQGSQSELGNKSGKSLYHQNSLYNNPPRKFQKKEASLSTDLDNNNSINQYDSFGGGGGGYSNNLDPSSSYGQYYPAAASAVSYGVQNSEELEDDYSSDDSMLDPKTVKQIVKVLKKKKWKKIGIIKAFKAGIFLAPIVAPLILPVLLPVLIPLLIPILLFPLIIIGAILLFPVPVICKNAARSLGDTSGVSIARVAYDVLKSDKCIERLSCELGPVLKNKTFRYFTNNWMQSLNNKMPSTVGKSILWRRILSGINFEDEGFCREKFGCDFNTEFFKNFHFKSN